MNSNSSGTFIPKTLQAEAAVIGLEYVGYQSVMNTMKTKEFFFGILREQYIILIYKTIKLELYALKDIFKIVLVFIPKAYG